MYTHLFAFFLPSWNANVIAGAAAIQRGVGFVMEMLIQSWTAHLGWGGLHLVKPWLF